MAASSTDIAVPTLRGVFPPIGSYPILVSLPVDSLTLKTVWRLGSVAGKALQGAVGVVSVEAGVTRLSAAVA